MLKANQCYPDTGKRKMSDDAERVKSVVPPLSEPWSYAELSKLDFGDAVYLHTILKKKLTLVEDRVEQTYWFLDRDDKYEKIFNFNRK
jgi:hypothetical protein